jgi:hypothetical protein
MKVHRSSRKQTQWSIVKLSLAESDAQQPRSISAGPCNGKICSIVFADAVDHGRLSKGIVKIMERLWE